MYLIERKRITAGGGMWFKLNSGFWIMDGCVIFDEEKGKVAANNLQQNQSTQENRS